MNVYELYRAAVDDNRSLTLEESRSVLKEHLDLRNSLSWLPSKADWDDAVAANAESFVAEHPDPDECYMEQVVDFVSMSSWVINTRYHVPCLVYDSRHAADQYDAPEMPDSLERLALYAFAEAVLNKARELYEEDL